MGLLGITSIVIIILQLYGARGDSLPMLPGNRLLTGDARELPGATVIDCGPKDLIVFRRKKIYKPSEALTYHNFFQNYSFTSRAVEPGALKYGGIGKFAFTKLKNGYLVATHTAFALHVDGSGETAYWLPQGGQIDILQTPGPRDPKYVFTADFSGCSWTVTPMDNGMLRLRHVTGDQENNEFNNLAQQQKGGPITYAMQFKDYGYIRQEDRRTIKHITAYAYMHFSNGSWSLHVQHQTCAPTPGNVVFRDGYIKTMKMCYGNKERYSAVNSTGFWRIP